MTPEQAAAMERVRRVNAGDDVADVYAEMLKYHGYEGLDTVAYSMCDSDRALLARLFIAERDDREIDEAWLLSIGLKRTDNYALAYEYKKHYGEDTMTFSLKVSDREDLLDCPWELWVESIEFEREGCMLPCEPKTRGDVLRLLSALTVSPSGDA